MAKFELVNEELSKATRRTLQKLEEVKIDGEDVKAEVRASGKERGAANEILIGGLPSVETLYDAVVEAAITDYGMRRSKSLKIPQKRDVILFQAGKQTAQLIFDRDNAVLSARSIPQRAR